MKSYVAIGRDAWREGGALSVFPETSVCIPQPLGDSQCLGHSTALVIAIFHLGSYYLLPFNGPPSSFYLAIIYSLWNHQDSSSDNVKQIFSFSCLKPPTGFPAPEIKSKLLGVAPKLPYNLVPVCF